MSEQLAARVGGAVLSVCGILGGLCRTYRVFGAAAGDAPDVHGVHGVPDAADAGEQSYAVPGVYGMCLSACGIMSESYEMCYFDNDALAFSSPSEGSERGEEHNPPWFVSKVLESPSPSDLALDLFEFSSSAPVSFTTQGSGFTQPPVPPLPGPPVGLYQEPATDEQRVESRVFSAEKWKNEAVIDCGHWFLTFARQAVQNNVFPFNVRKLAFVYPQVLFRCMIQSGDGLWKADRVRYVDPVHMYELGEWLLQRYGVHERAGPKAVADLQKAVYGCLNEDWMNPNDDWSMLLAAIPPICGWWPSDKELDAATRAVQVQSDGTYLFTPTLQQSGARTLNCHEHAVDIVQEVQAAKQADASLREIKRQRDPRGTKPKFSMQAERQILQEWKALCPIVRDHSEKDCCDKYKHGFHKQKMAHCQVYNVDVGSIDEKMQGLKLLMAMQDGTPGKSKRCPREVKCPVGLKENVLKTCRSGFKEYRKHWGSVFAASETKSLKKELQSQVEHNEAMYTHILSKSPKCRKALLSMREEMKDNKPICPNEPTPHEISVLGKRPRSVEQGEHGTSISNKNAAYAHKSNRRRNVNYEIAKRDLAAAMSCVDAQEQIRAQLWPHFNEECSCAENAPVRNALGGDPDMRLLDLTDLCGDRPCYNVFAPGA